MDTQENCMSSRLWLSVSFVVALITVAAGAHGDTVVFPSTSADNVHCADDLVENACGLVRFHGGHFATNSAGTTYVGGMGYPSCVSGELSLGFVGMTASDVSITIGNLAAKTDQSIRMVTTDVVDGVFTTTTTVQAFPGTDPDVHPTPPPPAPITLHATGHAITGVLFSIVNSNGVAAYEDTWWTMLSASVTASPIRLDTVAAGPTVAMRVARNSDGTVPPWSRTHSRQATPVPER
jgi:hypothetical protein